MHELRKWWLAAAGGAALIAIVGAGAVMAQTPSSTPGKSTTPTAAAGAPKSPNVAPGTATANAPHSNEDAMHEAGETPEHEAAEDSGQFRGSGPGGHHGMPNEDAAHEANETAEHEAAEDARQAPGSGTTPSASPSAGN